MKNVLAFLTEYKSKRAELDELKKLVDGMKDELTEYVLSRDEKGKATYTCKPFVVTITECTRTGLDEKTIRELFPDIAKEYETVTTYDRVTVK